MIVKHSWVGDHDDYEAMVLRVPDFKFWTCDAALVDRALASLQTSGPININLKQWRGKAFVIRVDMKDSMNGSRAADITLRPTGRPIIDTADEGRFIYPPCASKDKTAYIDFQTSDEGQINHALAAGTQVIDVNVPGWHGKAQVVKARVNHMDPETGKRIASITLRTVGDPYLDKDQARDLLGADVVKDVVKDQIAFKRHFFPKEQPTTMKKGMKKFYVGSNRTTPDWTHAKLADAVAQATKIVEDGQEEAFVVQIVRVVRRKEQPIVAEPFKG